MPATQEYDFMVQMQFVRLISTAVTILAVAAACRGSTTETAARQLHLRLDPDSLRSGTLAQSLITARLVDDRGNIVDAAIRPTFTTREPRLATVVSLAAGPGAAVTTTTQLGQTWIVASLAANGHMLTDSTWIAVVGSFGAAGGITNR